LLFKSSNSSVLLSTNCASFTLSASLIYSVLDIASSLVDIFLIYKSFSFNSSEKKLIASDSSRHIVSFFYASLNFSFWASMICAFLPISTFRWLIEVSSSNIFATPDFYFCSIKRSSSSSIRLNILHYLSSSVETTPSDDWRKSIIYTCLRRSSFSE